MEVEFGITGNCVIMLRTLVPRAGWTLGMGACTSNYMRLSACSMRFLGCLLFDLSRLSRSGLYIPRYFTRSLQRLHHCFHYDNYMQSR